MIIDSSAEYSEIWVTNVEDAICLEDETGENVYLDQQQAAELLPILEHFIKTGELPE